MSRPANYPYQTGINVDPATGYVRGSSGNDAINDYSNGQANRRYYNGHAANASGYPQGRPPPVSSETVAGNPAGHLAYPPQYNMPYPRFSHQTPTPPIASHAAPNYRYQQSPMPPHPQMQQYPRAYPPYRDPYQPHVQAPMQHNQQPLYAHYPGMCPHHHQDAGQPTVQNGSHQQSFHHGLASGSEIDVTSPAHGETPESIQKDTPPTQGIKSLPNSTEDAPTEESSGENATSTSSAPPNSSSTTISSGGVPDFVKKLFRMLEDTSESDIVGWGIHGDTFVVREPNEFAKTVLPRHFKHNNPASFVRQLNKYGFHKIRTQQEDGKLYGDMAWEFQHPNFQLNKKEMLESIRRKTTSKGKAVVTTVAPPTPITCNDMFATGLRKDTTDLQTQVDSLTKLQADIAGYLEGLSRNYRMVVEEVLNFRKNMAAQDQVIRSLVNYIAVKQSGDYASDSKIANTTRQELPSSSSAEARGQGPSFVGSFAFARSGPSSEPPSLHSSQGSPPGYNLDDLGTAPVTDMPRDDAQKLFTNYQEVARASVHQMNEISKHVRQAYSMMHPQPTFGSSASSSAPPPAETPATAGLSTNGLPFAQSGAPSALLAASTGQLADFPFQTAQQGGLTVFTVGGFTPRREDPVGDSGQNAGTKSPRPPNSMRVTRATCVPPWSVPPKVLLVEDDITCRKLSSKLLQVVGCAFDVAVDGLDAVERMGVGTKYDIVLMDIVMPNLDGVTATNRIRQFDQFTPIISMTSNTTENDCITYLANGMNDILAKPFNKHSMLSMIERYCNHLVGQRAAALGIPLSIASGRRWNGDSRDPLRISEVDSDEELVCNSTNSLSAENLTKGKDSASSTLPDGNAGALGTGLAPDYSEVLNLSMNEMTGLGILPFGNFAEGGYMNALGLDNYESTSSSTLSSQQQQTQQQQSFLGTASGLNNTGNFGDSQQSRVQHQISGDSFTSNSSSNSQQSQHNPFGQSVNSNTGSLLNLPRPRKRSLEDNEDALLFNALNSGTITTSVGVTSPILVNVPPSTKNIGELGENFNHGRSNSGTNSSNASMNSHKKAKP
ncbi:hypothetical protein PhCBS80983_g01821 [Powellomyces hirtus]|uniref:Response regulatory domain-containing protein n=1 Tax=Powellomyces hirtus TaxID=109895 RepID=A0A507EBC6_9FUNG|nr:hypothetical protein PhCBS80983_g01821 [Powellomyces hirtus]